MEDQRTIWRIRYWNGVDVWDQKPREMKELCFKYNEIFALKIFKIENVYWQILRLSAEKNDLTISHEEYNMLLTIINHFDT